MPSMTDGDNTELTIPGHVAVVMDGNGRWAKKRFLPRTAGHRAGVNATRMLVENCAHRGVKALTIFAFSSENWSRPVKEVDSLMSLFVSTITSEVKKLNDRQVCIRFIGDRERFPSKLKSSISEAEALTANNTGLSLNIAANYGGRWDIVEACNRVLQKSQNGHLPNNHVTEDVFARELSLFEQNDPDLFIRTGGESRISNFLIWQLAYTELYFTDVLWPDFDAVELDNAFEWYSTRQRRFGKISEQLQSTGKQVG